MACIRRRIKAWSPSSTWKAACPALLCSVLGICHRTRKAASSEHVSFLLFPLCSNTFHIMPQNWIPAGIGVLSVQRIHLHRDAVLGSPPRGSNPRDENLDWLSGSPGNIPFFIAYCEHSFAGLCASFLTSPCNFKMGDRIAKVLHKMISLALYILAT